ncbi:MAG: hypothetical protein ACOC2H_06430 [Spirochaetota bacterium]
MQENDAITPTPKKIIMELIQSSEIRVTHLRSLFLELTKNDISELFLSLKYMSDSDLTAQCMYYITLFRDDNKIRTLVNASTVSLDLVEYLILSLYAWALKEDKNEYRIISSLLSFFDQETYMRLLLESPLISVDKQMAYYIVPKLNRRNLEEYFNSRDDISLFLNAFMALPEKLRTGILAENSDFYGYISMILASSGKSLSIESDTMEKAHESVHKTQHLIIEVGAHYDMEREKSLPLDKRNTTRLAKIVKLIKYHGTPDMIDVMKKEGVIIDSEEESLIHEILYNPLFRNLQKKYCEETLFDYDSPSAKG